MHGGRVLVGRINLDAGQIHVQLLGEQAGGDIGEKILRAGGIDLRGREGDLEQNDERKSTKKSPKRGHDGFELCSDWFHSNFRLTDKKWFVSG